MEIGLMTELSQPADGRQVPPVSPFEAEIFESIGKMIEAAVSAALAASRTLDPTLMCNRLAFSEAEAASMLGVRHHVIRDARLAGKIESTRVGGRIAYTRDDLLSYLEMQKG